MKKSKHNKKVQKEKNAKKAEKEKLFIDPNKLYYIWFNVKGNDKEFIPLENQLRLSDTRISHPEAEIALIYSEKLLAEEQHNQLKEFCQAMNVQAIDVESVISEARSVEHSSSYLNLVEEAYSILLSSKSSYFTAILSDVLRLLVTDLGMYLDFDVKVKETFNVRHEVFAPFLTDIRVSESKSSFNNDFLAFPKNDKGRFTCYTTDAINKLKESVVANCLEFAKCITNIKNAGYESVNQAVMNLYRYESLKGTDLNNMMIAELACKYYVKDTSLSTISRLGFINYLHKTLSSEDFLSILREYSNRYRFTLDLEHDYKSDVLAILVMDVAGPSRYGKYIDNIIYGEGGKLIYDLEYNNLSNLIESQGSLVTLENGKQILKRGDGSWYKDRQEGDSILRSLNSKEVFEDLLKLMYKSNPSFPVNNIEAFIYIEQLKHKYYARGIEQNDNQNIPEIDFDLWYTGDQVDQLLHALLPGEEYYIAPHTQNGHSVTVTNIAQAILRAIEGRISVVPLLVNDNHWVSLVIRQNIDNGVFDVVFVDSLGNSIDYYSTDRIINIISDMTNSNFNLIDVSAYGIIQQQNNFNDCGVWTVDNSVNIARYLQSHLNIEEQELGSLFHINQDNITSLRLEHQNLMLISDYDVSNDFNSSIPVLYVIDQYEQYNWDCVNQYYLGDIFNHYT